MVWSHTCPVLYFQLVVGSIENIYVWSPDFQVLCLSPVIGDIYTHPNAVAEDIMF